MPELARTPPPSPSPPLARAAAVGGGMPRRRSRNNRVYAHGDPGGFDSDNADDADLSDAVDAYAEQYELAIERRGAKHGGGGGAVGALVRNVLSAEDADELARNLLRSYVKDARAKERVRARERSDRARRMAATAKREAQATDEAEDRGKVHRKAPPLSHMHRGASRAGTPSGAASRAAGRAARARDTAALGSPAPARRCASGERAFSHAALEEPAAPAAVDDGAAAGSSGALVFGTLEPGVVEWSMGLESALDSAVAARRAARSAVVGGGEDGPLRSSCADTFQAVEPEGTLSRRVSSGGLLRSSSGNKAAAASSAGSLQDEHETRARSEVLAINSQLKIFKAPPADAEKAVSRLLDHWESLFGSAAEPAGRGREWVHLVEKDAEQNVQALREWARLRNAHEALRKYAMTMEARAVVLDGSGAREMPWPSCGDALASLLQLAEEAVRARDAAHAHALRALRLDPIDVDGLQTALAPLLIAGQLSALAAAKRCRTLARHADTEAMMSGFSAGAALALSLNEVRPVVDGAADLLSLSANLTDIPGGVSLAMAEVMDTSQPLLKKAIADALRAYAEALRAANGAAVAARPGGRGALDDYLFCQHVAKTLPGAQIAVLHDFVPVACQLLSRVGDKVVVPLERPDSPRQAANAIAHASENLAAAEAAVAASQNLSEQLLKSYSSMARSEMSALREATTDASERVETVCELVARKVLDFHSIYLSVAGGGAEQLRAPDGTAADVLLARSLSLALKITGGPFSDEDRFDRANISLLLWCCSAAEAAMADLVRSASRAADGVGDTGGPTALGQSLAAVLHTHVASSVATLLEFGNNITQQSSNPVFYDYSQRGRAGDSYQRHGQRLSECFGRLLQAYAALPMLAAKILGASEPALLQQLDAADAWTVETLSLDVISFALDLFEADFMSLLTKQFAQVRADVAEVADMLPALRRGREDLQRSLDNLKSTNATSAGADLPGPVGSGSGGAQRKAADASNAPAAPPGSAREDSLAGLLKASASSSSLYTRYAEPTNWEIRRDDLNIISEVKGSRGQVFTAYFDHMTVAVKSLASGSLGALSEQQRQASANEVMLVRRSRLRARARASPSQPILRADNFHAVTNTRTSHSKDEESQP